MPPASRLGDLTAHGTPLSGGGSDDVYIGGMPAWRVGSDVHPCPLVTGAQPHVGGPVVTGSSTVLVNGVPIARVGDTIQESIGANTIVSGDPTVIVDSGTTGLASSGSGTTTESMPAGETPGTPDDGGGATSPPPTETLTPTPTRSSTSTASPTSTAPPTRERHVITDSNYAVEGEARLFYNLPAAATVFISFSSLDGTTVDIVTVPESDVRTLQEDYASAETVPGLTFREATEGSGQADLEAREWALVMRSLAPADEIEVPQTRLHLSLSVAWIDGPPSG